MITAITVDIYRRDKAPLKVEDIEEIRKRLPESSLGKATTIHRIHSNNGILSIDIQAPLTDIHNAKLLSSWVINTMASISLDGILGHNIIPRNKR